MTILSAVSFPLQRLTPLEVEEDRRALLPRDCRSQCDVACVWGSALDFDGISRSG